MTILVKKLKIFRKEKGWNQDDVARRLDISVPAYSKIETGVTDINLSRLEQLARLYDLSVVQMLSNGDEDQQLHTAHKKLTEREAEVVALQKQVIRLHEEIRVKSVING